MVLAQHVLAAQISPATEAGADTVRPLAQRLKATLRRGAEANPPHVLRKLLEDLRAAADEQVSEVEGARHAKG
jgi:malonyl-CoA decarboxylase